MSFLEGFDITEQAISGPYFGIIYGPPGVGKTFLSSFAEKAFIIPLEKGAEKVTGAAKPIKNGEIHIIGSEDEFYSMLQQFVKHEHPYKTVIVDGGMFLDKLSIEKIIAEEPEKVKKDGTVKKVQSIADFDFGEGYAKLVAVYERRFFTALKFLHKKGINVILIAHSRDKTTVDDNGNEYKCHNIDMAQFGMYSVPNLLSAKADWVLFMQSTRSTNQKLNAFKVVKSYADNQMPPEIVVHTRAGNGFFAKVRTEKIDNVQDSYTIDIRDPATSQKLFIDLLK
jgi:hypothetical protein